ncbi:MAG: hypothetical protein WC682_05385 [Parcubacteria group bacterium]|jgi:hypothetical protein
MTNSGNSYKYNDDKDIAKDVFCSFGNYLEPLYKSYQISKKTFILQVVNLVLVFILVNFLLDRFFALCLKSINGSAVVGLRILLSIVILSAVSAFKENKALRWQTLFDMGYELTKKWLFRFVFLVGALYLAKYSYYKIKDYDKAGN